MVTACRCPRSPLVLRYTISSCILEKAARWFVPVSYTHLFALPYMNVALGVVSPDSNVITTLDDWNKDDSLIVISGTTAETYLLKEYPDIPLQKYDSYANAKNALENGNGVAWANDNTEVIAFALQNEGYTVGIPTLGSQDTIAPAVTKGNETLLNWINDEIKALGEEQFFHKDYEETLVDTYGADYEDSLVRCV